MKFLFLILFLIMPFSVYSFDLGDLGGAVCGSKCREVGDSLDKGATKAGKATEKVVVGSVQVALLQKKPEDALRELRDSAENAYKKIENQTKANLKGLERQLDRAHKDFKRNNKNINENVFKPAWDGIDHAAGQTWEELEKVAKSLTHNWCELVEGQNDSDGKNDDLYENEYLTASIKLNLERMQNGLDELPIPNIRTDGINQGYKKCMDSGVYVGVEVDENGNTNICINAPYKGKPYGGCLDSNYFDKKKEEEHAKTANELAEQIQLWQKLMATDDYIPVSDGNNLPGINLPSLVENAYLDKPLKGIDGKKLDVEVIKAKDFIERLAPPRISSDKELMGLSYNEMIGKYRLLYEFQNDQEDFRIELENTDIDLISTALYIAVGTKFAADTMEFLLDAQSAGAVTVGKYTTKYIIKEALSIAGDAVDSNNIDEFSVHLLTRRLGKVSENAGKIGSLVSYKINKTSDMYMLTVKIPKLKRDSARAKADNLSRIKKMESRAKRQRYLWEGLIQRRNEIEGISNSIIPKNIDIERIGQPSMIPKSP